ncbi:MAG: DNA alkylation repair protein [Candidatus Methanomethylophilaceae archaeon]|nr:DNA alkylation repair protein [Candidatus Methanomethylophilaceae archaeon]
MIDYRRILEEEAEPNYRDFTSKLIPGKEGIMGVRIPKIRALAKRIIKDDWESFLEEEPGCFEEEFLRGLVIATAPMDTERRLEYTGGFLDRIDNWSTCDSFCSSWKYPKKDSERVHSYFRSLIDSGQEYRMRVSVVFRMSHFIDDQHVDGLLADIESYRNEGYYYKMGAAWAASFCYIAYPEKTMAVLKARKMDDWVYRKTIQKICESYRVSDEDKAVLRSMR